VLQRFEHIHTQQIKNKTKIQSHATLLITSDCLLTSSPWSDSDAQLAATHACLFTPAFFAQVILTSKVGHIDLVFGVRLGLIGVHARLQVSVCSTYDLWDPA